jgi:hypothetical protein
MTQRQTMPSKKSRPMPGHILLAMAAFIAKWVDRGTTFKEGEFEALTESLARCTKKCQKLKLKQPSPKRRRHVKQTGGAK